MKVMLIEQYDNRQGYSKNIIRWLKNLGYEAAALYWDRATEIKGLVRFNVGSKYTPLHPLTAAVSLKADVLLVHFGSYVARDNSFAIIRKLKAGGKKVIVITNSWDDSVPYSKMANPDAVLAKPIDLEELKRLLRSFLVP